MSELDIKRLRDRVQYLQNELIRVSQGLVARGTVPPPRKVLGNVPEQKESTRWGGNLAVQGAAGCHVHPCG